MGPFPARKLASGLAVFLALALLAPRVSAASRRAPENPASVGRSVAAPVAPLDAGASNALSPTADAAKDLALPASMNSGIAEAPSVSGLPSLPAQAGALEIPNEGGLRATDGGGTTKETRAVAQAGQAPTSAPANGKDVGANGLLHQIRQLGEEAGFLFDMSELRPDVASAVSRLFNEGPNRWIQVQASPPGRYRYQRGLSSVDDYIYGGMMGVAEALSLLRGEKAGHERFAVQLDDPMRADADLRETTFHSRPLSIRGNTDKIAHGYGNFILLSEDNSIDNVESIGTFMPDANQYFWARSYLALRDKLAAAGMAVDPESRGGRFTRDLRALMPDDPEFFIKKIRKLSKMNKKFEKLYRRYSKHDFNGTRKLGSAGKSLVKAAIKFWGRVLKMLG